MILNPCLLILDRARRHIIPLRIFHIAFINTILVAFPEPLEGHQSLILPERLKRPFH